MVLRLILFISIMSFWLSLYFIFLSSNPTVKNQRRRWQRQRIRRERKLYWNQKRLHRNLECLNLDPKNNFYRSKVLYLLRFTFKASNRFDVKHWKLSRKPLIQSLVSLKTRDKPFQSPLGALWWWRMEKKWFFFDAVGSSNGHEDEYQERKLDDCEGKKGHEKFLSERNW